RQEVGDGTADRRSPPARRRPAVAGRAWALPPSGPHRRPPAAHRPGRLRRRALRPRRRAAVPPVGRPRRGGPPGAGRRRARAVPAPALLLVVPRGPGQDPLPPLAPRRPRPAAPPAVVGHPHRRGRRGAPSALALRRREPLPPRRARGLA